MRIAKLGGKTAEAAENPRVRPTPGPQLWRRQFLFPMIVAAHVLLLLMLPLSTAPTASGRSVSTKLFDVADMNEAEENVRIPEPPKSAVVFRPEPIVRIETDNVSIEAEPIFDAATAARAGFGTTCDIAETLRRAFEDNEPVRAALAQIRPEDRSVANAIMIWDGEWVELSGASEAGSGASEAGEAGEAGPVDVIRRGISEGIRAAPADCLHQHIGGPRFIPIRENERTTIMVVGSGVWQWDQLLAAEPGVAVSEMGTGQAPRYPPIRVRAEIRD